jgi:hypothetical protein
MGPLVLFCEETLLAKPDLPALVLHLVIHQPCSGVRKTWGEAGLWCYLAMALSCSRNLGLSLLLPRPASLL